MKTCTLCGKTLPLSDFQFKVKARGILMARCRPCCKVLCAGWRSKNLEKARAASKAYHAANRERTLEQGRLYRRENRARLAEKKKAYRAKDPDRWKQYQYEFRREWRKKNVGRVRATDAAYERRKRAESVEERLNGRMSARIREALKNKRGTSWVDLVGYDAKQLARHLERQFVAGMDWENIGRWHIDHIIPLSTFRFESADDADFKAAWALSNLRPLWAAKNIAKHASRELLL